MLSTNLIDGGDPAGTSTPEEDGCLAKIVTIKTIITQGNINTTPSGIETLELPRNRIRLRRKAKGDNLAPFSRDTSSMDASAGAEGRRLTMRRTIFMVAIKPQGLVKETISQGRVEMNCLLNNIEGDPLCYWLKRTVGEPTRSISLSFSLN